MYPARRGLVWVQIRRMLSEVRRERENFIRHNWHRDL